MYKFRFIGFFLFLERNLKSQKLLSMKQGNDEYYDQNNLKLANKYVVNMWIIWIQVRSSPRPYNLCVWAEKKDVSVYEVCLKAEESLLEAEEEETSEEGEGGIKQRGVGAMVKIFHFIMKQSYICALIAMMVSGDQQLTSAAAAYVSACKQTNPKHPSCISSFNLCRAVWFPAMSEFMAALRSVCGLFSSGLEHHVRQLADVCLPHVVVHAVDGEGSQALRHALLSLHGRLRQPAHRSAVHLEFWNHGAHLWTLCEEGQPLPLTFLQGENSCAAGIELKLLYGADALCLVFSHGVEWVKEPLASRFWHWPDYVPTEIYYFSPRLLFC